MRSLLSIDELKKADVTRILRRALDFKEGTAHPSELAGKRLINLFYEPSTRTRVSFESAARNLGLNVTNLASSVGSQAKGESLVDTGQTLRALGADIVVIRHPDALSASLLARHINLPVINGGDGTGEHPTQALVDLMTIAESFPEKFLGFGFGTADREIHGESEGEELPRVIIVGDIRHSRVARSDFKLFAMLGMKVTFVGPPTLMPDFGPNIPPGLRISYNLRAELPKADVLILLRIQAERAALNYIPSVSEYSRLFGMREELLSLAREGILIMHPGPTNRGVELDDSIMQRSVINRQALNGVFLRMAVITECLQ